MLLAFCAVLAGCGKASLGAVSEHRSHETIPAVSTEGAVGVATKNTTRLGGSDQVSVAAGVARAVYPGLTTATRPRAVVLVDEHDWPAALAASALASAPLSAALLYSNGEALPQATAEALSAMRPVGAATLGGVQVIRIGSAAVPSGLRTLTVSTAGAPATVAASITHLLHLADGGAPNQVIVLASDGPPALQMPAAGLAAESGSPILFVNPGSVPAATAAALRSLGRPAIYLLDPQSMNSRGVAALAHFGHVTPIAAGPGAGEAASPVDNAIAIARFTDGAFGWGVKEPGHGLVFANAGQPFDAPASALLSASGDYAPLLLLESANGLTPALTAYLSDIQPAYSSAPQFQPVHGAYNHGWLLGDEQSISVLTQAEIDTLLEISPRRVSPSEEEPASLPSE